MYALYLGNGLSLLPWTWCVPLNGFSFSRFLFRARVRKHPASIVFTWRLAIQQSAKTKSCVLECYFKWQKSFRSYVRRIRCTWRYLSNNISCHTLRASFQFTIDHEESQNVEILIKNRQIRLIAINRQI